MLFKEFEITPFKGRTINKNEPVKIYRNLNDKSLSIVQDRLVVGHTQNICLVNCKYKVGSGRERVLIENRKNVHAYVIGLIYDKPLTTKLDISVAYNPYLYETFVNKETKEEIKLSKFCLISSDGEMKATKVV